MKAMERLFLKLILSASLVMALIGCGSGGDMDMSEKNGGTISNPETEMYKPIPLMWEGKNKDGVLWSAFSFQVIGAEAAAVLLPGADDIREFCPNYSNMRDAQKVNFWAFLVSAITKHESAFNPIKRTMSTGNDEVTGTRLYAEGLLALAYRDIRNFSFCAFDWEKDKHLSLTDKARTILDPLKNLDCGIKILATQVETFGKISHASTYWNALKPSGLKSRLKEIQTAAQQALPFCQH